MRPRRVTKPDLSGGGSRRVVRGVRAGGAQRAAAARSLARLQVMQTRTRLLPLSGESVATRRRRARAALQAVASTTMMMMTVAAAPGNRVLRVVSRVESKPRRLVVLAVVPGAVAVRRNARQNHRRHRAYGQLLMRSARSGSLLRAPRSACVSLKRASTTTMRARVTLTTTTSRSLSLRLARLLSQLRAPASALSRPPMRGWSTRRRRARRLRRRRHRRRRRVQLARALPLSQNPPLPPRTRLMRTHPHSHSPSLLLSALLTTRRMTRSQRVRQCRVRARLATRRW